MPSIDQETSQPTEGRTYWQSLAELGNSKDYLEFIKGEFPEGVDLPPESEGRRRFLQVMAASIALATTTGCHWPKENIRPFANRPDGMVPGIPRFFATSMDLGGVSRGLLVKSFDGRPINVEGNNLDPISAGAADKYSIASLLDLYDPDRSQEVLKDGKPSTWADVTGMLAAKKKEIESSRGAGLRFLTEASSSPSRARLKAMILSKL
ncbi:MAG: TAT-variant-translocated molybdopterin oxidoreductase, partial [Candidatus Omnitrophica bacterium]|nr:TAT-variant-translocated molybdopterin oxidoreductase [Candidatus Omnitrophota bacterium]